ncbi:hypothetical protein MTO96_048116 [Rhipicephalus appendiculatus]
MRYRRGARPNKMLHSRLLASEEEAASFGRGYRSPRPRHRRTHGRSMPRTKLTKMAGRLRRGGGMGGREDTTPHHRRSSGRGTAVGDEHLAEIRCGGSSGATVAMETSPRAQGFTSLHPDVGVGARLRFLRNEVPSSSTPRQRPRRTWRIGWEAG